METLRIGRDSEADIVIDDDSVSRVHASLTRDEQGFIWLEDVESINGVHLHRNGNWLRIR